MANYVAVVPFIYQPYADELKKSLKLPEENVNFIDNTDQNRGVAGSWNMGIEMMKERHADWLIIMSAAMRMGKEGGLDMIEQLDKHPDAHIVNFANRLVPEGQFKRGESPGVESGMFSWHCCAISRKVVDEVGKFDANFYPIYFEDIDYDLRVEKAFGDQIDRPIVHIYANSASTAHAITLAGVKSESTPLIAYFAEKWGKHPSATEINSYDRPFNNPKNSLAFWPPAHGDMWNE